MRNLKPRIFTIALLAFALLIGSGLGMLSGCSKQGGQQGTSEEQYRGFGDSTGRNIVLKAGEVERVAVADATAQEMLLTIAPGKLVGLAEALTEEQSALIGDYSSLPVFGSMQGEAAVFNQEALKAAGPQVIVSMGASSENIRTDMDTLQEQTGIPVAHIDVELGSIERAYSALGELLGMQEPAQKLGDYCRTLRERTLALVADVPASAKPQVAYLLGKHGRRTMPENSAQAAALDSVCINAMKLAPSGVGDAGEPTSAEQIALWDPDIIVFGSEAAANELPSKAPWKNMSAIENARYCTVPTLPYNWLSSPIGPCQLLGQRWLAGICYPDLADLELKNELAEYLKAMYGHELTNAEYKKITAGFQLAGSDEG